MQNTMCDRKLHPGQMFPTEKDDYLTCPEFMGREIEVNTGKSWKKTCHELRMPLPSAG